MADERKPGLYRVKWSHESGWEIAEYRIALGQRFWVADNNSAVLSGPAVIGPRIPTPDEAASHTLDGPERPEEIER